MEPFKNCKDCIFKEVSAVTDPCLECLISWNKCNYEPVEAKERSNEATQEL